jgi:hypothetical protein
LSYYIVLEIYPSQAPLPYNRQEKRMLPILRNPAVLFGVKSQRKTSVSSLGFVLLNHLACHGIYSVNPD